MRRAPITASTIAARTSNIVDIASRYPTMNQSGDEAKIQTKAAAIQTKKRA
jgi:hypothetical protein